MAPGMNGTLSSSRVMSEVKRLLARSAGPDLAIDADVAPIAVPAPGANEKEARDTLSGLARPLAG